MKGMRYRVPGIAAEVYKELGVAVVTLAGGEVLPAGERGVLDATEWYTPGEDISIGLHQVWKFYHYPGMHETAGACDLLINQDVWDKLAPDLQAIVRAATMQAAWRSLLQFNRLDAEALRDFKEKHKVTLVKTPDDVLVGISRRGIKLPSPKPPRTRSSRKSWSPRRRTQRWWSRAACS